MQLQCGQMGAVEKPHAAQAPGDGQRGAPVVVESFTVLGKEPPVHAQQSAHPRQTDDAAVAVAGQHQVDAQL